MKRLIWTIVLLAFYMSVCVAQTIAEYTFSTTTDGTLQDMTGSTNFTGFNPGTYYDDTAFGITNIGFSFSLGASSYTQLSINSNGQMQLGSTAISGGQASPAANTARIAPLSGDNCIRTTGKVHYLLTGSAPNRKLTVEWLDLRVPYSSSAETGTYCRMQVWLYEGSNNIKFVYGTMWNMATSATSRGVYISTSNVSGTIGMVYNITSTPTWANTGSSVTNTSFNASSAMLNLDSSTDGSRRVFHINYPVYTTPPNPAVLLSPTNNGFAFNGDALTWQSGGGAPTGYDVYFGTSAYPGLVSNNQQSTSYTPTLVAGTTYFWKVVAHNQYGYANESATWSFKVPNGTQLAESFESTTFPPTGWANPGTWSRITSSYKYGTASAYKYGSSSAQYILSTPKLTITPASIFSIWTMCSSTTGTLQIVYSPDRTTWTQIGSNITHAVTGSWYNTLVDLGSLAGNNYYLGIRTGLQSTSFYVDMCVGPELAPEVPGVPILSTPADFATNVLENTTFTWTAPSTGGVPSGYRVYCDTDNPPTTQIADVNALTFTPITPLEYNTLHYWTVMAYNGEGNGVSATVRSFTTRANPTISSFPTVWDFGTLTADPFPPTNWTKHSGVLASPSVLGAPGTGNWIQDDWKNITTPANKAARINIYSTYNGWLISPPIAVPGNDYEVRFDVAYMAYGNNNAPGLTGTDDQFAVMIGDGTSWTSANVVRKWDNAGSPHVLNEIPPAGISVSLPLGTAGTKYVAFYGISTASNADNDLMVDNIEVRQIPAAPIFHYSPLSISFGAVVNGAQTGPTNVTITNNGGGTLSLSVADISLLGPNSSQFSLGTSGLPAALGAGQSVLIPVYVTGLTEGSISATLRIVYNSTNYDIHLSATVLPEGVVMIGNGTGNRHLPIYAYFSFTYSQSLFLQSEINVPSKRINQISYYWNGALEGVNSNDWTVYMGHTAKTAFASTTDWIPTANLTQVFSGNVALPATPGWINIALTTPFVYNNTDNLVIAVDENEAGYEASSAGYFLGTIISTNRSICYYNDGPNPDPAAPPTGLFLESSIPNVMLQFGNLPSNPLPAINPSPTHQDTGVSLHPTFSWQPNPYPGNPAPTGYKFSLWDSNGYLVENQDLGNVANYNHPQALIFNTLYSWKVVPYTTVDAENCPTWTFTTIPPTPPQNLVGVENGANVALSWSAPESRGDQELEHRSLTGYKVWRFLEGNEANELSWTLLTNDAITGTTYTDITWQATPNGNYKWAVKALYSGDMISAAALSNMVTKINPPVHTAPIISNVAISQRTDGSSLLDIYYDVYDEDGDLLTISLAASKDNGETWNLSCSNLLAGSDIGAGFLSGTGKHIVWDVFTEHPELNGSSVIVRITAIDASNIPYKLETGSPMPVALGNTGNTPTVVNDNIYIFGGHPGYEPFNNHVYKYDTGSDQWADLGAVMPYGTCQSISNNVVVYSPNLVYITPCFGPYIYGGWGQHSNIMEYNVANNQITNKASFPGNNWGISPVKSGDYIYTFGIHNGSDHRNVYRYHPPTDQLLNMGELLPNVTNEPGAIKAENGLIYLFGGNYAPRRLMIFNPATESITYNNTSFLPFDYFGEPWRLGNKIFIVQGSNGKIYEFDTTINSISLSAYQVFSTDTTYYPLVSLNRETGTVYFMGGSENGSLVSTVRKLIPNNHGLGVSTPVNLSFVLLPPENLVANATGDHVMLHWSAPNYRGQDTESKSLSPQPTRHTVLGYNVFRNNVRINTELVEDTGYYDFAVSHGVTYTYYVQAVYAAGVSEASNVVTLLFKCFPEINVSVNQMLFSPIFVGETQTQTFLVTNTGSGLLQVTDIEIAHSDFTITPTQFQLGILDTLTVHVTIACSSINNITNMPLTIHSNAYMDNLHVISISIEVYYPPVIDLSTTEINKVLVGNEPQMESLTISNLGEWPLEFNFGPVPNWFSINPTSGINYQEIVITFYPAQMDSLQETYDLVVYSNDLVNPSVLIHITATKQMLFYTTNDNENNANTGIADNDMDVALNGSSPLLPVEFNLLSDAGPFYEAKLIILANGVDEASGYVHNVSFNGHNLGRLRGNATDWCSTVFTVDPAWIIPNANNLVQVFVDPLLADPTLVIDRGQMQINGQTREAFIRTANVPQPLFPGATASVQLELDSSLSSQSVSIETLLYSPGGILLARDSRSRTLNAQANDPFTVNLTIPHSGYPGVYEVKVLVFSGTLGLLQDLELIPVQVNPYQSAIAYNPTSLNFGQVLTEVTSSLPVTIQNTGLAPLQITQLNIDNPVFSITESSLSIPAGGSYQLSVSYLPLSAGTQSGTLSLSCNDPINPYPQIALSGEGIPNIPYLNVSTNELAFGEVFTVVPQTLGITIGNTGPAELFVWDITSSDPAFSAVPTYFSLAQNQSREVFITFSPTTAGEYSAQLTLSNNSANLPSYVLNVSGTGAIAPEIAISPLGITQEGFTGNVYTLPASITNTGGGSLNWQVVDHFGKALKTRGHTVAQSDYAVIPNQQQNQLYGGNWTVSAWFRVESNLGFPGNGGKQYILSKASETANGFFGIYTSGIAGGSEGKAIALQMRYNSQNYSLVKNNLLSLNTWYHVAVSYSDGTARLYLNGAELGTLAVPGYNGDPTAWALGKLSPTTSTTYRFCGGIDEFRVYNQSLSASQIKQSMFSRLGGTETGLTGYWNMDSGSVTDLTPYLDHGTLYGGATIIPSTVSETPAWLGFSQTYGSTQNGTPDEFNVVLNTNEIIGGQYNATMQVRSNDPIHSIVQIPVSLSLTGYALISLSRENIDFGNVFVNETSNQQLTIYNNGTDVLNISSISSSDPAFVPTQSSLIIAAGASANLGIAFHPTLASVYAGQLSIQTSVPGFETMTVNLSGTGALHPLISINPTSFSSTIAFGTEETQQLTISNLQGIPLEYSFSLQETGSRDLLNGDLDGFPANIRGMVFIGNLMYLVDYANARLLTYDPQTQTIIQQLPIHANPWGICYDGTNLWIGSQSGTFREYNFAGELLRSFSYPLATNPSISYNGSEFLIGKSFDLNPQIYRVSVQGVTLGTLSTAGLNGRLSQTTWVPWHSGGQLWAVDSGAKKLRQFSTQGSQLVQLQSINCNFQESASIAHNGKDLYVGENQAGHLFRVDDGITEFNWISVNPESSEVVSGQSENVSLNFQARTRFAGNYTANLTVSSNDPLHPQQIVPLSLTITGQPSLHLHTTIIPHGHVFSNQSDTRSLIIANLGTANLNVTLSAPVPYSVDVSSFTLAPLSSRTVYVTFSPTVVGSYPASLTITTNDPTNPVATVTLEGECVNPPIASVSPISITTALTNTANEEIHTLTLSNTGGYSMLYDMLMEELEAGDKLGSTLATYPSFPDSSMGMVWANSHLYVVNNSQAKLMEYDPATHSIVNAWGIHSRPCGITWDGQAFWIGDQSGYLYKYLPADLLAVGSIPAASFKSPINGIPSVCWTGTDFLLNNSWVESGNTTFYRVNSSGQTLATYSSNAGTYIAQTAWVNQYQGDQLWAFQNVKEGDQFVSGKILKLSISGASISKTQEKEFHDNLIGFSFTGDGKDLWYSDGNGPLYKLDDGRWLSASPVKGNVAMGTNLPLAITVNPRLRNGGTYHANLLVNTNDPAHQQLSVPVTLNLTGIPEISVNPNQLAFPNTYTGESSQLQLAITNNGTDILSISSITCNLAVYSVPQQTYTIGIGATQFVTVSFNPLVAGAHNAILTINSNAGENPALQVPLTGSGVLRTASIGVASNLVNFGNSIIGNPVFRDLMISNTGSGPLNITSFVFSSPVFSTLEQTMNIASGNEAGLRLFFSPAQAIAYNGTLTIYSNDPNQPEKIVMLSGLGELGQSSIAIDPLYYNFGTVSVGNSQAYNFTIGSQGNSPLIISQITSSSPAFSLPQLPIVVAPGTTSNLEIVFCPTTNQLVSGTLNISSNDPLNPVKTIIVEGTGEFVPILSYDPGSFDRYIVAETNETQYLTIGNSGTAVLNFNLALSGNPVWLNLSQTEGSILPGANVQIGVIINTATVPAGTYQSAVVITCNDLTQPQKTIPVTLVHSDYNFTTLDNDNNAHAGVPDGDLDVNINEYSAIHPIEFNIWTDQLNPADAILRIRAYNITANELSEVRINHQLVGTLCSSPSAWGISQFRIPAALLNFGNNVANGIQIDLDTTHQNPGSSRLDWGQLLFTTDGLFANIRYFYVDSSNHYPGSNVHAVLENDTQLYTQNVRSEIKLLSPIGAEVAVNNLQGTISYGNSEPQGTGFTIPVGSQAGTWTLTMNLYDADSSILQESRSTTFEVGSYLPQLSLLSSSVDFGSVFSGQTQVRNLVVRNIGQAPLYVTELQINDPAFSVATSGFTLNYNQSQTIPITFSPTGSGSYNATLSMISNDAGSPALVPLTGLGVNPPQIALSEYSVTKQLYISQTGTEQLRIYNQGDSPLMISSITRVYQTGSGWLTFNPSSATINPGIDIGLNLNFNTGTLGTGIYDATLSITSNDPVNGYLVVPITLQVSNRPTANFTALPLSGNAPLTVQFTDTSTPLPGTSLSTWLWDFANNGVHTSNLQNPQWTYTTPGTYSVKLTVTTNTGLNGSTTKTGYITVLNNPPVLTNPGQQLSINMLENTSNSSLNLYSVFSDPDGDPLTFTHTPVQNVGISISNGVVTITPAQYWSGLATLTFTARDNHGGQLSTTVQLTVNHINNPPQFDLPQSLSFLKNTGYTVDFAPYVLDPDVEDSGLTLGITGGSNISYSINGRMVTFSAIPNWTGSETLFFTVSDGIAEPTQGSIPITVLNGFNADFFADNLEPLAGITVQFTDTTPGNPNYWAWEFDYGVRIINSFEQNPTYTYSFGGFKSVKLNVAYWDGQVYQGLSSVIKSNYINVRGTLISGAVSGFWPLAGSPFVVSENIFIPAGNNLEIQEDVSVVFLEDLPFQINGSMVADGVSFGTTEEGGTRQTPVWKGLYFNPGSAGSNLQNISIKDAETPISINGAQLSLAHINITKSDSLSLPLETGVKIENSSLSLNDLEISNYSKGIKVLNTLQTRTPITPSLTNIRIRNTSSSVRPDAIGIELTGFVEADIDQLDLQDFGTGIKYIGTGELAGTNPSLTNIRIRNTNSSVRTEGTAIYVKDVPVFSIVNNPALPDSILDYKKGIVVETETAASSNPSISNIRIRNTSSSVRTDATAIELSGNVSGTYSNLDLTDYFIGLSATNETTAYSTPSLTNIRIRNTSSSVRPLSSAIVLSGKVSSSMNNLTIDEYDNGIVMDGDGTFQTGSTPSITNIRIRSTSSSVRSMGTAISVTDVPFINIINSPTAADSIVGYNTGIAIQTTLGTTSNASISNVRIRNTSSSVRTDDTAIELTGKVVPNFTNLDLDDYSTGISHVGDGTYQAGQTPSLTNIRIRNTSSSVREGLTGLYIKDVPYYSVTGDSICGFTTGVNIVNEQQAVSAPSLTNVRIRNTSSSVRPALAGVSVTGLAAVNLNNLEVIDYSLGISLTGTGQETSTQNPSLTNIRIRNTSSSVRTGSKGIELKNLAFATLDDETIEGYIYGVWIENTLPTISAPEIKNSTLRFADSTLYPDATGIYSLGKVQGSVHHNLVDGYSLGTSLFGQNATAYTNNQYLNCHTGFRVEGASANPNLSYNVLRKSGVAALPLLSAFSLVNTTSLTVRNNTIYGYQSGISALAAGCDFTQNIVWAAQPIANPINAVTSMVNVNYNNIYDASGTTAGTANMNAQPAFINELDGDYHLSLYSPCIDAGDPTLPRDPDGSIADLGCFYYAHGASFSVAPPSGSVINEPVQFTSSSVGHDPNTAIYQWSFVDPLQIDSYAANPTHTYTQAGAYDITLTMQTGFFSDTVTLNGYTVWDTAPLPVPQNVQAVADLDQITLSWDSGKLTAVFTGAKSERATALGYRIYRKAPSAVDFSLLTQLPLTQSSYLDQALTPGLWSYYVVSYDAETESANSGIATAEVAYQLYAPRSLKAYHSNGKARLTWLPPLENSKALNFILRNRLSRAITLQSYELYRDNQLLIILPSTQTSYLDEGVTVGTAYSYYLVAIYNYGASQGSNSVSITPLENTSSTAMNYNSGDGSYSATLDPQGDGNFVDIVIIPNNPIAGEISIIYSTNPSIINGLSNPDALGAYFAFEGENPNAFTGLVTFRVRLPYQTNDIWYRSGASWNLLNQDSWILLSPPAPDFSYEITINFDRKGKAGKVEIASDKGGDSTLPIHLSSFTATLGSGLAVSLKWTVESETDHLGYNVLRSDTDQMIDAIQINSSLIDQGTSNGTAITYVYSDQEVEDNHIYYYWLESLTLSGVASYAGPISVTIGDPGTPEIPVPGFATHLMDAFPNPFNPNTNIRYAITEPGDVHISIYNLKGQLLHSYQNSYPEKGYYQVSWDGRDDHGNIMGSGVYLYKMQFGRYSSSKKMILMK